MGNLKIRNKLLRILDRLVFVRIWCLVSIRHSTLKAHLFTSLTNTHLLAALRRIINFFIG
jgi:hypothetical protein